MREAQSVSAYQFNTPFKIYGSHTYNEANDHGRPKGIQISAFDGANGFTAP